MQLFSNVNHHKLCNVGTVDIALPELQTRGQSNLVKAALNALQQHSCQQ